MRLFFQLSAVIVLAMLALAGCNSSESGGNRAAASNASGSNGNSSVKIPDTSSGSIAPSDGVKRITTVELRDALEKGTALVVDVRGDTYYKQSHIKGSISIPLEQVAARTGELPRDKMIVTYCS